MKQITTRIKMLQSQMQWTPGFIKKGKIAAKIEAYNECLNLLKAAKEEREQPAVWVPEIEITLLKYIGDQVILPEYKEVAADFGWKDEHSVSMKIRELKKKGLIEAFGRGFVLTQAGRDVVKWHEFLKYQNGETYPLEQAKRDANPIAPALVAEFIYPDDYDNFDKGIMSFWDHLDGWQQNVCIQFAEQVQKARMKE